MKKRFAFALILVASLVCICIFGNSESVSLSGVRRPTDGSTVINESPVALDNSIAPLTADEKAARDACDMINALRAKAGLKQLSCSPNLATAAEVRAAECSQLWSHTRPDGSEYWTVDSAYVYGENLAKGYSTAEETVSAWMASPSHRDNILFGDFRSVGIAIYEANGCFYWATEFGY